ncbi:MAG: 2-keto-4-pentenoate hydratase [Solirubrobacteraceae bacterium]
MLPPSSGSMAGAVLTDEQVHDLGDALLAAFERGEAIEPLTDRHPDLSVTDAYRVQRRLIAGHEQAGRTVGGRKIGLTSEAIQRQLGVDVPDFGVLLDTHVLPSATVLSRRDQRLIAPRVEPELAVVLDRPLAGPGIDAEQVRDAVRAVLPVLEIIDSRIVDWRIGLADTIADNASCFGVVTGDEVPVDRLGPLADVPVTLSRDGEAVQRGVGAAVMGDPLAAVAWLADELGRLGDALPAGQPVLCGSFTAAVDAVPGTFVADFGPTIGSVSVEVVA